MQVVSLIKRIFSSRLSREPNEEELADILRLIWIQVLDLEDDRADARAAYETLANAVLAEPSQARLAWSTLTGVMSRLAIQRSGETASALRLELKTAGIVLKSPRTYEADIAALRCWTRSKLSQGVVFTRLVASDPITAIRRDVFGSLQSAPAAVGSFLVTGEPGSGKSGVIYELADALIENGKDVLFLPVPIACLFRVVPR